MFEAKQVTFLTMKKVQPPKVDSEAKSLGKRLTRREKLALLEQYEKRMSLGENREHILNGFAESIQVSTRQVERILAQANKYRQEIERHFQELSTALLTIAMNFESYLNDIGPALARIGDFVYGGDEDMRFSMGMRKVDKSLALNVLHHLKDEYPELYEVKDWADLTPGGIINDDLIQRLQLKAHSIQFSGKCPACPH